MKRILSIAFVLAIVTSVFWATTTFAAELCYGTLDGGCRAGDIRVQQAEVITLPADVEIATDIPATFRLTLPDGVTFVTEATVDGGTIFASGSSEVVATCSGPCVIALGKITGPKPGDIVTAQARLFDPNGVTETFFDGPLTLARILGEHNATAWIINPASNENQRTFLRIVAPDNDASIAVFVTDDAGVRRGPLPLTVLAGQSVQLNSTDIEQGNPSKGFPAGAGTGVGKWRIDLASDQRFRAFALSTGLAELPTE